MRFLTGLSLYFCFVSFRLLAAGENCNTPVPVTVGCPAVTLNNQTTAGMGNDISYWKLYYYPSYYNGEDIVYQLSLPSNISDLVISVTGANKYSTLFYTTDCNINSANLYPYKSLFSGNTENFTISVAPGTSTLYVYLDHSGTVPLTYNISFGAVMKQTSISIPDTRGNLGFVTANCRANTFLPYLDLYLDNQQVTRGGGFGTLNQSHTFCIKLLIKNLTGQEAVKSVSFNFNAYGFKNISLPSTTMPGFYSTGNWNAVLNGNTVNWVYTNTTDATKGDGSDQLLNCMEFSFCIAATPMSTSAQQVINIWVTGDGKTPGYTGYQYSGCCATNNCNLYGAGGYRGLDGTLFGGGSSGATGFGTGIGPGGLPVDFLNVWLENQNLLKWQTANEHKVSHYLTQYSLNGNTFDDLQTSIAKGNDIGGTFTYESDLTTLHLNTGYLRIKSIDENGDEKYSKSIRYTNTPSKALELTVAPNPSKESLRIVSSKPIQRYLLYTFDGTWLDEVNVSQTSVQELIYPFSVPAGIYTLVVLTEEESRHVLVVKE